MSVTGIKQGRQLSYHSIAVTNPYVVTQLRAVMPVKMIVICRDIESVKFQHYTSTQQQNDVKKLARNISRTYKTKRSRVIRELNDVRIVSSVHTIVFR